MTSNTTTADATDDLRLPETDAHLVPFKARFFWGLGSLGTISYINIVTALVLVYLTTIVRMDAAVAGTLVFVARIVDAFSDPAMGWLTDRTRTRWGRRRPYLLLGALVCGTSLPLVYSIHTLPFDINPVIVTLAALIIYSLGFTIFNVPYLTMPVEMTTDRMQRFSIMSYRVVFMMTGALIGSAGGPFLVEKLGKDAQAFQTLGLAGGALVGLVMFATFIGTKGARASAGSEMHLSIMQQIRTVAANKPFVLLIGMKVAQFFAIASAASTAAFFVSVVLKQPLTLLSVLGLASTASIVVSVPFWKWLGRFITKRRGLMIGVIGEVFATLTWLLATPEHSTAFFVFRGILTGFFSSSILLYSQAMWLDTIDYDQQRTGLSREGMYTSVYVFVERLGYSLGPLVLGFLLSGMGFDKNLALESQPASAQLAVYIGLVWIPSAAYTLGFILLWFYRLPERVGNEMRI
jgi:GPH family glycoside/pentoside/hexuronide:cation symporter